MGWVRGGGVDAYSGDGGLEPARLLFTTGAESLLEVSLVVGTRVKKELIINNSPNSELADSRDTGPLLEISFMEKDGS